MDLSIKMKVRVRVKVKVSKWMYGKMCIVQKVGRIELAWGKSKSGFKYQNESESESIKVDVWKDVKKVGRVELV